MADPFVTWHEPIQDLIHTISNLYFYTNATVEKREAEGERQEACINSWLMLTRNSSCCHLHLRKMSLLSLVLTSCLSHFKASRQALDERLGWPLAHLEEMVWEQPEARMVYGEAYQCSLDY